MNTFTQAVKNFWNEEEGVTAIEYSLIAALIAVVIIASVDAVGVSVKNVFDSVNTGLKNV